MKPWYQTAFFYHIYPLGFCNALQSADPASEVGSITQINALIPHLRSLGINALYLGPVFKSTYHGYDTIEYFQVDPRLGSNADLKDLSRNLHQAGIRLVLDAVFNHTGRDFWAFKDVLANPANSLYRLWFSGFDPTRTSPFNDPFSYQTWNGHYELVKLDLAQPAVVNHLLDAVRFWKREFSIDGLRLDAADCLDLAFIKQLRQLTNTFSDDFWLMGEIIHGDYRTWANDECLHSVTNYENYKSNYSSLVDKNYFEIAYSLNRQYGREGMYRNLSLYNFCDNHDVDRAASHFSDPRYLHLLYLLLFTIPGVPSIYYGSEWGASAKRTAASDVALRPVWSEVESQKTAFSDSLESAIRAFAALRQAHPALIYGTYEQVFVSSQIFAFMRKFEQETILVVLNATDLPQTIDLELQEQYGSAHDLLTPVQKIFLHEKKMILTNVEPWGSCVIVLEALC